jgi:hypothetical protein
MSAAQVAAAWELRCSGSPILPAEDELGYHEQGFTRDGRRRQS